jgi:hypothetical protein
MMLEGELEYSTPFIEIVPPKFSLTLKVKTVY